MTKERAEPPILQIENPYKRRLATIADAGLKLVAPLWSRLSGLHRRSRNRVENPRTIVFVRPDHIGDFILTLPAMARVRAEFPHAHTIAVVGSWSAELARLAPAIDEVIAVDCPWWVAVRTPGIPSMTPPMGLHRAVAQLRERDVDLAIDFRGDVRHILHFLWRTHSRSRLAHTRSGGGALLTHTRPFDLEGHVGDQAIDLLRGIGVEGASPPGPHLREAAEAAVRVSGMLGPDFGEFVLVQAGARSALRAWPAERYPALLEHLRRKHGLNAVLVGDEADRSRLDAIAREGHSGVLNLAGRTNLPDLVSLALRAKLFIGSDSGVMHLACACGLPVVALFGPNHPRRSGPRGVPYRVARRDFPCSPCLQLSCPLTTRAEGQCMQDLELREVLGATEDLLAEIEHIPSRT